ncbi:hypothetical protein ADK66_20550 [Micromonospora sp. NRRL B-16802]|uniref:hypothetical protein n=1 Tax=Micromonospora sp. NRRL B-16802 TaxID=1415541 RepID=UPI0006B0280D|nr:hypothetical protein [Micromonospora sp. NRRL B-16802]KOX07139.1 hypothetical protein ADK66_20550 [Micromonospora sp. NRRL B-16802]
MSPYSRAYRLGELRAFDGWAEPAGTGLTDDDVVYLRDDLTVVRTSVLTDPQLIWDSADPRWQDFCITRLRFDRPADLRPTRD